MTNCKASEQVKHTELSAGGVRKQSPLPFSLSLSFSRSHSTTLSFCPLLTLSLSLSPPSLSLRLCLRAYRSNTLKHSSLYEALLPVLSPMLLFILSTLWVALSPNDILQQQPRVFFLMVGTAFANVTVSNT